MKNYIDFKAFRKDFNEAIEKVAEKYGVTLKAGNISYDENTFTMKVMAERSDIDVQKAQFEENLKYMGYYGFTAEDYKAKFIYANKRYTMIGFKPGNKYDVIAARDDGKQYGLMSTGVAKALGKKVA